MFDDGWRPPTAVLLAVAFDAVLAVAATAILLSRSRPMAVLVVGAVAPLVALGAAVAFASWTRRHDPEGRLAGRVAVAAVLGSLVFCLAGGAQAFVEQAAGVPQRTWRLSLSGWACGGAFVGTAVGLYDAARRRRAEEVREARREADDLAEGLSVLNRVLRHDIRNRTNVALGAVTRAESDMAAADARRLREGLERVVELADRARTAERVIREDGEDTVVDVAERVRVLATRLRREHPDVTIRTELPDTAPARCHHRIEDALEHVTENAVEHGSTSSRPGADDAVEHGSTVGVTVRREAGTGESPGRVLVEVDDDGPGIPQREVDALAEDDGGQLSHSRGTGLWLTKWIVEGSGGDLAFDRTGDEGTRVTVGLRAAAREERRNLQEGASGGATRSAADGGPDRDGSRDR